MKAPVLALLLLALCASNAWAWKCDIKLAGKNTAQRWVGGAGSGAGTAAGACHHRRHAGAVQRRHAHPPRAPDLAATNTRPPLPLPPACRGWLVKPPITGNMRPLECPAGFEEGPKDVLERAVLKWFYDVRWAGRGAWGTAWEAAAKRGCARREWAAHGACPCAPRSGLQRCAISDTRPAARPVMLQRAQPQLVAKGDRYGCDHGVKSAVVLGLNGCLQTWPKVRAS